MKRLTKEQRKDIAALGAMKDGLERSGDRALLPAQEAAGHHEAGRRCSPVVERLRSGLPDNGKYTSAAGNAKYQGPAYSRKEVIKLSRPYTRRERLDRREPEPLVQMHRRPVV